jgi:hypothetical protein
MAPLALALAALAFNACGDDDGPTPSPDGGDVDLGAAGDMATPAGHAGDRPGSTGGRVGSVRA